MRVLTQNESNADLRNIFCQAISTTDYYTPTTGKTLTIEICKGNAASYSAIAGSVTEIGSGTYKIALAATDLDTVGQAIIKVSESSCVTQFIPIVVQSTSITHLHEHTENIDDDINTITDYIVEHNLPINRHDLTSMLTRVDSGFEIVSLNEFKLHIRQSIDYYEQDDLLSHYLNAAIQYVRKLTGVEVQSATYVQKFERFPTAGETGAYFRNGGLRLAINPVISVSQIAYLDTDGTEQVWEENNYTVESGPPTTIFCKSDYPDTDDDSMDTVWITYTAGQSDDEYSGNLFLIKQAILLLAAHWYRSSEPVAIGTIVSPIPFTLDALVSSIMEDCRA